MKTCPFSKENNCYKCNLFSEEHKSCIFLVIGENLNKVFSELENYENANKKSKRPIPPEHWKIPPVISKPPMSPVEAEEIYKMKSYLTF